MRRGVWLFVQSIQSGLRPILLPRRGQKGGHLPTLYIRKPPDYLSHSVSTQTGANMRQRPEIDTPHSLYTEAVRVRTRQKLEKYRTHTDYCNAQRDTQTLIDTQTQGGDTQTLQTQRHTICTT